LYEDEAVLFGPGLGGSDFDVAPAAAKALAIALPGSGSGFGLVGLARFVPEAEPLAFAVLGNVSIELRVISDT
jgi:hypothetical protein